MSRLVALPQGRYGTVRGIAILADSTSDAIHSAAEIASVEVRQVYPLAQVDDFLSHGILPDATVIVLAQDDGAASDSMFDRIETAACDRRLRSVVVVPTAMIDAAMARLHHCNTILLADPSLIDLASAISRAVQPVDDSVGEGREPSMALRILALTEEVGRLARRLAVLSDEGAGGSVATRGVDAPAIRAMIRARRLRDRYFGGDVFADPAWDILLDLAAARLEGHPVAVSSLCIAAAVPPTTALRWIRTLTDQGLLERQADPDDRRRIFISLSEDAAQRMHAYLAAASVESRGVV